MKILLYGEFSGFYTTLAAGLASLGHEVVIAATGDGYKAFARDVNIGCSGRGLASRIIKLVLPWAKLNELKGFDVVQAISPCYPSSRLFPHEAFFRVLRRLNGSLFFSAGGFDPIYWRVGRHRLNYGPFEDFLKYDYPKDSYYMDTEKSLREQVRICQRSNGVIPNMYDYDIGYRGYDFKLESIPLPIDIEKHKRVHRSGSKPVHVFHGLTRYGFKGTHYVEKVFREIKDRFKGEVKFTIDGHLPFDKYTQLMNSVDILIDQTSSYSSGINGLLGIAKGMTVLGGSEREANELFGIKSNPIINITPDCQDIQNKLMDAIENHLSGSCSVTDGLPFLSEYHDHIHIAKKYLEAWESQISG